MALERKTVTKPAEPHPFEAFGASTGGDESAGTEELERRGAAAPDRSRESGGEEPRSVSGGAGRTRRMRGSVAEAAPDRPGDPLVTRTYRIPESYDARLQRGSLKTGMQRGHSVNKSDLVREAIDEYMKNHNLDD